MKYILSKKLKYYTKEILKYFNITVIAFGFIIAIILIKYKPIYRVSISGEEIGYVQSKEAFEENIKEKVLENQEKNIEAIDMKENPEYELKLVDRTLRTNEEQIVNKAEENLIITYKYYEIAVNNETVELLNTIEEAEELVTQIKEENEEEPDLSIIERFTQNVEEVTTSNIEVAKAEVQTKITQDLEKQKEEEIINS